MRTVADLEADAFKRDRGFLGRLALVLIAGTIAGLFMYGYLTGETVAGCAAQAFGGVTETPAPQ
jgi:hypothetical protein